MGCGHNVYVYFAVTDTGSSQRGSIQSEDSALQRGGARRVETGISANEGTGKEKIHIDETDRILIAEDTDSNYDLLNAILGKQYRLVRANDGMEAVLLYDEVKPDLILMDIKMPNLDGLEATKIIRELSATVPIIAQSAFAYEHDVKAAMEAGCNDFIAKPIAQSKLKEVINKWLTME